MKNKQFIFPVLAIVLAAASSLAFTAKDPLVAPDFIQSTSTTCEEIPLECDPLQNAPICTYDPGNGTYVQVYDSRNAAETTCSIPLRHNSQTGKLN